MTVPSCGILVKKMKAFTPLPTPKLEPKSMHTAPRMAGLCSSPEDSLEIQPVTLIATGPTIRKALESQVIKSGS